MIDNIPFNKPYFSGNEINYIKDSISKGKISGNGFYTKKCTDFFQRKFGFDSLLTSSCTDALEMAAILINIKPGDEVIIPSYTFVSTANAFALRGARIIFADSRTDHPGMDESSLNSLITEKTKAIVPVHYAGVACNMDYIMSIANQHNIYVIEDAAQAIDAYYYDRPLGSIGHLSAFSFHETKNVIAGEGGMLVVNDKSLRARAEIIWEKGTNRSSFFRGEVDKYGWVDIGSSFLPSDMIAAFLYAQLESLRNIQDTRIRIWNMYFEGLKSLEKSGLLQLPSRPEFSTNNAHMFYLVLSSIEERQELINFLKSRNIMSVFHYISLHKSSYYASKQFEDVRVLKNCERYADCLLRLPLYMELDIAKVTLIINSIKEFFNSRG